MPSSQLRTFVAWSTNFEKKSYLLFPHVVTAESHEAAAVKVNASGTHVIVVDAETGDARRFAVARTVKIYPQPIDRSEP